MIYQFSDYWAAYIYDVREICTYAIIFIILIPIVIYWGKHTTRLDWGQNVGAVAALFIIMNTFTCYNHWKEIRLLSPIKLDKDVTPICETGSITRIYYYSCDGGVPYTDYKAYHYPALITIDGVDYIVYERATLMRGEEIEFCYLPNSKCILEWHYTDETSENNLSAEESSA